MIVETGSLGRPDAPIVQAWTGPHLLPKDLLLSAGSHGSVGKMDSDMGQVIAVPIKTYIYIYIYVKPTKGFWSVEYETKPFLFWGWPIPIVAIHQWILGYLGYIDSSQGAIVQCHSVHHDRCLSNARNSLGTWRLILATSTATNLRRQTQFSKV